MSVCVTGLARRPSRPFSSASFSESDEMSLPRPRACAASSFFSASRAAFCSGVSDSSSFLRRSMSAICWPSGELGSTALEMDASLSVAFLPRESSPKPP